MRIMLAAPAYNGTVNTTFMVSVLNLFGEARENNVQITFRPIADSLITRARNNLVQEFLNDESYTHLCFIDTDIGFAPSQFWRLLTSGHRVACAIYPFKHYQFPSEPSQLAGRDLELSMMKYVVNAKGGTLTIEQDKFAEALDAATGFMMISRDVFDTLKRVFPDLKQEPEEGDTTNYYGFFDCMVEEGTRRPLSEDYAFCRRCQQAGIRIMVDVASELSHTGPITFHGNYYRTQVLNGHAKTEPPKPDNVVPMKRPKRKGAK
jgi:hypothetical protein